MVTIPETSIENLEAMVNKAQVSKMAMGMEMGMGMELSNLVYDTIGSKGMSAVEVIEWLLLDKAKDFG